MRADAYAAPIVELVNPLAEVVANVDGRILWWNRAAGRELGDELRHDRTLTSLIHPDDSPLEEPTPVRDCDGRWCYAALRDSTGTDGRSYRVLFLLHV